MWFRELAHATIYVDSGNPGAGYAHHTASCIQLISQRCLGYLGDLCSRQPGALVRRELGNVVAAPDHGIGHLR